MFCLICSFSQSAWAKWEVKWGSLSNIVTSCGVSGNSLVWFCTQVIWQSSLSGDSLWVQVFVSLHYALCANGYSKEMCQDTEIFVQVMDHFYDAIGGAETCAL